MKLSKLWNTEIFLDIILPALTVLFGLQLLRVLVPSLVWYLGDTLGAGSVVRGVVALCIFSAGFLLLPFYRALGLRRALIGALVGIALARLGEQFSTLPALDFALALVGVVLFMFFFPLYFAYIRVQGDTMPRKFARGFMLGIVFDTTLHGSFHTLDLSWQHGFYATGVMTLLIAAQLWLVYRLPNLATKPTDASFVTNLPLAAIGPFLFIMQVILQNVARATELTGFPMPLAFGFVSLTSAVGIAAALVSIIPERQTSFAMLVGTGFLAFLVSRPDPAPGTADLLYFFGNLLLFPFITVIFSGAARADRQGITHLALVNAIGWLLFGVLTLLYYVSYEINLGFPRIYLMPLAVTLIGFATVLALRRMPSWLAASNWVSATIAFALFIVPMIILANWHDPKPVAGQGLPVRVMTYNLHNGFSTEGRLDPEAIAQTIERVKPDIIGLQEIERGWYIDGSLDLAMWMSRRLQMPFVFGSTAGPVWGNAILSRYPIKEAKNVPLPPRDLPLRRGYLWARIDVGGGDELLFVATHYHHLENGTAIRQVQSTEIAKFLKQKTRTILVGDLNALPEDKEISILRDTGFRDAVGMLGTGKELTWPADQPRQLLDYIWFSPDLTARDLQIPPSTASDHFGVAVTVGKK